MISLDLGYKGRILPRPKARQIFRSWSKAILVLITNLLCM